MRRSIVLLIAVAMVGCSTSTPTGPQTVLQGPDGQRRFLEWPLERSTLQGPTLTLTDMPRLKWTFAADGTHSLTNGGSPLGDDLKDLIEIADYRQAKKATGTWTISTPQATGMQELTVRFTHADGKMPSMGCGVTVFPYHSSASHVHFCRDTLGQGGIPGKVRVFKITPAEGRALPQPPG